MGTIRNRMTVVQHWNSEELEKIRKDAVKTFQEVADSFGLKDYNVEEKMISPVLEGFSNTEYTFVINGECSKLGWEESDLFQEVRKQWCEKHKNEVENMLIVDFGEDYKAAIKEFKRDEED